MYMCICSSKARPILIRTYISFFLFPPESQHPGRHRAVRSDRPAEREWKILSAVREAQSRHLGGKLWGSKHALRSSSLARTRHSLVTSPTVHTTPSSTAINRCRTRRPMNHLAGGTTITSCSRARLHESAAGACAPAADSWRRARKQAPSLSARGPTSWGQAPASTWAPSGART